MSERAPYVLVPQFFGSLVFERETGRYLPMDHEITALLRAAMDAPVDLERVPPARREGARSFLDEFYPRGMFTLDLRFAGEVRELAPPSAHLSGPLVAHLEVNAVCNLACVHCFAGELPRRERPLDLDELDALFADLSSIGTLRLGLSGGEPLLRKDLYELIDAAVARGLHPSLTTNGLLLDPAHVAALAARSLLWLNVSLDGATAATNDAIRGAGTFDRVLEKVSLLRDKVPFALAMTVTRGNHHEARAFGALARAVGAQSAVLRPLYPAGLARDRLDLLPTLAQYRDALAALTDGAAPEGPCDVGSPAPFGPEQRELDRADVVGDLGCGAGTTIASISASGVVSPCSYLGPAYDGPSVREKPFSEIWREARAFERLRAPEATRSFAGGCRARSLALAGSAFAPDPWIAPDPTFDALVTLRRSKHAP